MYSIIIDKKGLKKLRNTNNYIVYKNEIIQAVPYKKAFYAFFICENKLAAFFNLICRVY